MRKLISLLLTFVLCSQIANAQVGLFIRPNSSSLSSPVSGQTWLFDSSNNTIQVYNGSIFQVASAPQNNFTAVVAPTSSNDNTQGYSGGSEWYNTVTGFVYSCIDATTSAAVWIQINNLGSLSIPLTSLQQGSATTGQSLIWNGSHWAPSSPNVSLNNLLQTGALTGQIPQWNGSAWVPVNIVAGGAAPSSATYLTIANETSSLANSSRIIAGAGITLTPGTNTLTVIDNGGVPSFGDTTNWRPLPTSGTIAGGTYRTSGNWTQTGAITFNSTAYLYFGGNVTFNNNVVVTPGADWNQGGVTPVGSTAYDIYTGNGEGPSGGACGGIHQAAGGGGGCGGAGGPGQGGSSGSPFFNTTSGGLATSLTGSPLMGSGGGSASTNDHNTATANGGAGGGGLYIEAVGNVAITGSMFMSANGVAGQNGVTTIVNGGGGGSGGVIDIRSKGNITVAGVSTVEANGGLGGTAAVALGGGGGGGGGGGIINFMCLGSYSNAGSGNVQVFGGANGGSGPSGVTGVINTNALGFFGPRINF